MDKANSIEQLKYFLKEMFQFNANDLDFGIYRIYNLKRKEIENFIDGSDENCLEPMINKTLDEVKNIARESELVKLRLYLSTLNQQDLLKDIIANKDQIKLFIQANKNAKEMEELLVMMDKSLEEFNITDEIKDKIYSHILGYFEMYYSNGDFGYNDRSRDLYKVPYEADYDGSDTMFHWKHKGSLYIKTGNSFNAIKFKLKHLDKEFELRLETNEDSKDEEVAQNNNKNTQLKHYKFNRIEEKDGVTRIVFNLSDASTTKADLFKSFFKDVFKSKENIDKYLFSEDNAVFQDLENSYDKVENGKMKGINDLRIKRSTLLKKVNKNFERGHKISLTDEGKPTEHFSDQTLETLYNIDQKLNSFYIGNDSDYFIHENLQQFLTQEKDRYIKNYILSDLKTILDGKLDNTTIIIAKAFDMVTSRIIEFMSAIEEFQKKLFTMKKKVVESEYCLTIDNIDEKYYKEILENKAQLFEWKNLFSVKVKTIAEMKAQPTLVLDTKFFRMKDGSNPFKDKILGEIENLDEKTNGLLINSENYQGLLFLEEKYRNQIKTISIDPPYNTGGDGFLYKDNFKHSSWVTMMQNRLSLSHDFLSDAGAIFIHINENELWRLANLMNELWEENNLIEEIIWRKKSGGGQQDDYIVKEHEYILFYAKDKSKFKIFNKETKKATGKYPKNDGDDKGNYKIVKLAKWGSAALREDRPTMYDYPELIDPDGNQTFPLSPDKRPGRWRFGHSTVKKMIEEGKIHWEETDEGWIPYEKEYEPSADEIKNIKERSIFYDIVENTAGSNELKDLFGLKDKFQNPKPSDLIFYPLLLTTKDFDIVFDFFGGSATIVHSVIKLNNYDNGIRKFLCVEMGKYFDEVTKPRVQKVIFSSFWNMGKPNTDKGGNTNFILKYLLLEQYEDVLDAIKPFEEKTPKNLPLKYLYKPELNKINSTLDLSKPFSNKIRYGQPTKEGFVDLVETYNYLQGYEIKSIKTYTIKKKYYKVVETPDTIISWRDIELGEDDSKAIFEIAEKYPEATQIEVNYDFNILATLKDKQIQIGKRLFNLNIIHAGIFNQ
ncbi:MAG TPA: site-specific DNA-methyltransferase [Ignavibacteria bacterium]|nr:site-specific DNA-methyltransferase [Ignavibacteria bacterium]HMR41766.1 site-specific DNA-methyltransferase [Ignavibacteria bacterium]